MDALLAGVRQELVATRGEIARAMVTARAIALIEQELSTKQAEQLFMPLLDSPHGFLSDRPPGNRRNHPPYDWPVVRRALVSAFLNGVRPVNNEFNIISGRCYIALNGWRRKFEEISGLTDASLVPGVPRVDQAGGFAVVNVSLSWKLHGVRDLLRNHEGKPGRAFAVSYVGVPAVDQLIGKAKAKAYKAGFEQATGTRVTGEDDGGEVAAPAALPGNGSRSAQIAELLNTGRDQVAGPAVRPAVDTLRAQVRRLIADVGLSEDEWAEMADGYKLPADLNQATADQLEQAAALLADEKARAGGND